MPSIITKKYKLVYTIEEGVVLLDLLEVDTAHRCKGVGTRAMQRFLNKFKNRHIELHAYAQDECTDTNKLVSFYEKFGFSVVCGCEKFGYEMIKN